MNTEKLKYKGAEVEFIDFDKPSDKRCLSKFNPDIDFDSLKLEIEEMINSMSEQERRDMLDPKWTITE